MNMFFHGLYWGIAVSIFVVAITVRGRGRRKGGRR